MLAVVNQSCETQENALTPVTLNGAYAIDAQTLVTLNGGYAITWRLLCEP